MSFRDHDGCGEWYNTFATKYTNQTAGWSISTVAPITGSANFQSTDWSWAGPRETFDAQGTWTTHIRIKFTALPSPSLGVILNTTDAGSLQGSVTVDSTGKLFLRRGTTNVAGPGTTVLAINTEYSIELRHIIDPTTGTLECRINGAVELTFTGNTRQTANSTADACGMGCHQNNDGAGASTIKWDDFYAVDGAGAAPTTYIGPYKVNTRLPSGAGNYAAWVANGAATDWQCVSETPADDDTTYASSLASATDRMTFTKAALDAAITAVKVATIRHRVRRDDGLSHVVKPTWRISATDYDGTAQTVNNATYANDLQNYLVSPATGVAFTPTEVNNAEFGIAVVS